jgi:hypothetical protein
MMKTEVWEESVCNTAAGSARAGLDGGATATGKLGGSTPATTGSPPYPCHYYCYSITVVIIITNIILP